MTDTTFRSCWVCNPAHEHLKTASRLHCIDCGTVYKNGVPVGKETPLGELVWAELLKQTEVKK